jgi:hypothetical protein
MKLVGGPGFEPGASRSRPAQPCFLPYPGGSLRVLLYSIAELVVSSPVLSSPPVSS